METILKLSGIMHTTQQYGATYTIDENGETVIGSVFPVDPDWEGYRFHGYCRPSKEDIRQAGY